eukprot:tig00000361_g24373.t1
MPRSDEDDRRRDSDRRREKERRRSRSRSRSRSPPRRKREDEDRPRGERSRDDRRDRRSRSRSPRDRDRDAKRPREDGPRSRSGPLPDQKEAFRREGGPAETFGPRRLPVDPTLPQVRPLPQQKTNPGVGFQNKFGDKARALYEPKRAQPPAGEGAGGPPPSRSAEDAPGPAAVRMMGSDEDAPGPAAFRRSMGDAPGPAAFRGMGDAPGPAAVRAMGDAPGPAAFRGGAPLPDQKQAFYKDGGKDEPRFRGRGKRGPSSPEPTGKGVWGKKPDPDAKGEEEEGPKEKPNFQPSGALAKDTNTYNGVVFKFNEPPEARVPRKRWRLYIFKGDDLVGEPLKIHRQSCYLFGRERKGARAHALRVTSARAASAFASAFAGRRRAGRGGARRGGSGPTVRAQVCDVPTDHPSCSKQHAVLQYRLVETDRLNADLVPIKAVKPYIMDLESTNGTFLNDERIEASRYYELREKDVLKFGTSSRTYVLLHDQSADAEIAARGGLDIQDEDEGKKRGPPSPDHLPKPAAPAGTGSGKRWAD